MTPLNQTKEPKIEQVPEPEPKPTPASDTTSITKAKSSTTRGKGKKGTVVGAAANDQTRAEVPIKPKTRGKTAAPAPTSNTEAAPPPPKTRSRAKSATTEAPASSSLKPENIIEKPGRTRAGSGAATAAAAATRSTAASAAKATKAQAPRKRVTFQDPSESDKENLPLPTQKATSKKKNPAPASTQTRSKSTRKPASATVTKGRAAKKGATTEEKNEGLSQPLSPKKITQIAKSSSSSSLDSEEDELSGGKTPLRVPAQSPIRPVGQQSRPVTKLDFGSANLPKSPEKQHVSAMMLSSPRRPPPSPFKDAMKESPKRADVPFVLPQSAQKMSKPTPKASHSQSTLQQSPKRGNIDSSIFLNSTLKSLHKSPMKASLLQSPARRLFSSAKRPLATSVSPKKSADMTNVQATGPYLLSGAYASPSLSRGNIRALAYPDANDDPYVDQPAADVVDFDESVLDVRSPVKVSPKKYTEAQPLAITEEEEEALPVIENDLPMGEQIQEEPVDTYDQQEPENAMNTAEDIFTSLEPSKLISIPVEEASDSPRVAMTEHLFRSVTILSDEESEDELQSNMTPAKQFIASSGRTPKTLNIRPSQAGPSPVKQGDHQRAQCQSLGFTPLAVQFGNWLAASPDRPVQKKERRGVFSPVKLSRPLYVEESEIAAEDSAVPAIASPEKGPRRKSVASRKSLGGRKSVAGKVSVGGLSVAAQTPRQEATFFEDEMAVRELEEDVESLETEPEPEPEPEEAVVAVAAETADEILQQAEISVEAIGEEVEIPVADTAIVSMSDMVFEGEAAYRSHLEPEQFETRCDVDMEAIDNPTPAAVPLIGAKASEVMLDSYDAQRQLEARDIDDPMALENGAETVPEIFAPEGPDRVLNLNEETAVNVQEIPVEESVPRKNESPNSPLANVPDDASPKADDVDMEHLGRAPLVDIVVRTETPNRPIISLSRFHHNTVVSKVPLRQEGQDSPLKVPRKRSRSLSADTRSRSPKKAVSFSPVKRHPLATTSPSKAISQSTSPPTSPELEPENENVHRDGGATATTDANNDIDFDIEVDTENLPPRPTTPSLAGPSVSDEALTSARKRSPTKSTSVLSGAVVFVDVHTSEGADASGIFIDLLTQMGARCVKQWSWNPRASVLSPEPNTPNGSVGGSGKVGITHVIYKDGGKRTLEKVRDAKGVVKCVGVGWVLDCEARGEWVDEAPYSVDTSIFPRGGSRRRKSMEPRALVNQNGSLFQSHVQRKSLGGLSWGGRRSISADLTPAKKHLGLEDSGGGGYHAASSPITGTGVSSPEMSDPGAGAGTATEFSRNVSGSVSPVSSGFSTPTGVLDAAFAAQHPLPQTPTGHVSYDPSADSPDTAMDTPYLMREGGKLVQMSCPPKQTRKGLFDRVEVAERVGEDRAKENAAAGDDAGDGDAMKFRVRRRSEMGMKGAGRRRSLGVVGQRKARNVGIRPEWKPSPPGRETEAEAENE